MKNFENVQLNLLNIQFFCLPQATACQALLCYDAEDCVTCQTRSLLSTSEISISQAISLLCYEVIKQHTSAQISLKRRTVLYAPQTALLPASDTFSAPLPAPLSVRPVTLLLYCNVTAPLFELQSLLPVLYETVA